jgi:probable phosphoglycerate mutase
MTQLLLIRHARNDWVGQRLAGWTPGVHLNEAGRAEAAALASRLQGVPIDAVYASPLERAQETAGYLTAPRGLPIQLLAGLGEAEYGRWTGQSIQELRADPLWDGVQHWPSGTRFPEGETLTEVQARAVAALEAVRPAHADGVFAAVSHADVIKAVIAHYAGLHLDLFQRLVVSPASVSVVRFTAGGPRLLLFNDTGQVPPPEPGEASLAQP